jgi:protein O-mannosyl-transferase
LSLTWTIVWLWFSIFADLNSALQTIGKGQPRHVFSLSLLLFGLVYLTFLPVLHGDFIEFDDLAYVTSNPVIRLSPENIVWTFSHSLASNWHPLTLWSLMLDHQLWKFNPWGYHLTNLLLHAANSVLVFLLLRRWTGAAWRSLLVAALFGLHPLRAESVGWISERKDVLCVFFWMLSLGAYARFAQNRFYAESRPLKAVSAPAIAHPRFSIFAYVLSLFWFALSLMSKPMAVTLPAVLILLDFWPWRRWRRGAFWPLLIEKIPFFTLSAVLCVVTYFSQKNAGMMKELVGVSLSWDLRLGNALVSYVRYLGKLFWPAHLCAFYPHPGRWPLVEVMLAALVLLALSLLAFAARRQRPYLLAGWFWFLITLVPVIGLIQVGAQGMADRYSYLPSVGILIIAVWELHLQAAGWRRPKLFGGVIGGGLVLACILLTRHQITFWQDGVALWRRAVDVTENNYDAHNRLGRALYARGSFAEAVGEFQEAIRLNPCFAEPWCSLGRAFAAQGRMEEAISACEKALQVRPGFVAAHNNLSDFLLRAGRLGEAMVHCRLAAEIEPGSATVQNNLANALALSGQLDEALAHFQKALAIEPDNAIVHANFGSALFRTRRPDEAIPHFRRALELQPDNAKTHNNLGGALLAKGLIAEAVVEFRAAAKLQPERFEVRRNLGHALLKQGSHDEAILVFQEALKLQPASATASNDLIFALSLKRKITAPPPNPASP